MIPRAVDQVFQVAEELKSKGWEYTLEGQFLEIVRDPVVCIDTAPQSQSIVQRNHQ
jgi:kinesin family protein C1